MAKKKTTKTAADKALPDSAGSESLPITPRFQQVLKLAEKIARDDGMNYADTEHLEAAIKNVETKHALGKRFHREELEAFAKEYLLYYFDGKISDEYFLRLGLMVSFSHFLFQNRPIEKTATHEER